MKDLFNEILAMEDIQGVLLLSSEGETIFKEFNVPVRKNNELDESFHEIVKSFNGIREADLLLEKGRVYIRKSNMSYLIVIMGSFASAAMVRLSCDMILPSLNDAKAGKGLRQIFKRSR
jgi:hypothetical protein